ncbi:hypothetical protein FBZ89_1322 [Nitrospirillum amazonense]|uniref:Acyl carrier protein n=1 Tax=Nitrospirillum amazonense TaxID=28077 RepID=A0A560EMY1_9PROT|nr:hypothetical protein FBZ89_1322 [Nitrospirillum amazonense]
MTTPARGLKLEGRDAVSRSIEGVTNWMHLFRWIVKLIRDDYGVDEKILTRTAVLETDCGLSIEQVEEVLDIVADSFAIRFPQGTLDEVLKLEELCLLAAWLKGMFKRPDFISDGFEAKCRAMNASAGA